MFHFHCECTRRGDSDENVSSGLWGKGTVILRERQEEQDRVRGVAADTTRDGSCVDSPVYSPAPQTAMANDVRARTRRGRSDMLKVEKSENEEKG